MKIIQKLFIFTFTLMTIFSCSEEEVITDKDIEIKAGQKFIKKTLIENITSTNCGSCPGIKNVFKQIKMQEVGNVVIPVATYADSHKEMMATQYMKIITEFGVSCFPWVVINRENKGGLGYPQKLKETLKNTLNKTSSLGIKISSTLTTEKAEINFKIFANDTYSKLKYSVYLLENNYKKGQAGVQGLYTHNHILVKIGDYKKSFEIKKGEEKSYKNSLDYKLLGKSIDNVDVVVFITDNEGKVLQAQIAKANEKGKYTLAP